MSDYSPPVRDMKFVLEHICHLNEIVSFPAFEHVDPEVAFAALDEGARFFSEVLAPTNRDGDTIGSIMNDDGSVSAPPSLKKAYGQYVAAGWGAVKGPMDYGGHGFPGSVGLAILEMMTSANMAFSLCPMLSSSAILAIDAHGSDEQKATYLEKLVSGEWTGTMVLTEPEAGSDVGALRAKATPNDDGTWTISGTKIFITWGDHDMVDNIVHLVLARTPEAPPGTKGLSLFLVPKLIPDGSGSPGEANGVKCLSIEHKLGIHASPTCVLDFADSIGSLIGEENQGMRAMFTMMNDARLHVGLEGMGVAERSYQQALEYSKTRTQGRAVGAPKDVASPIIEHPDVRRMLMTMRAYIEGVRALLYDIAGSIDRGHHAPDEAARQAGQERAALLTPIGKAFGTDLGVELTSIGIQIHGGPGYVEETGSAQFYRDARIAPIYEGTNGIQAIDLVMRKLPMRGGGAVDDYLAGIEAVEAELRSAGLDAIADPMATARAQVAEASAYLLACENPNDALAGATPYLRMLGLLASCYYLARQAVVAQPAAADDEWMAAKVATARFYATQLLPQVGGLLPAAMAGSDQLFAIDLTTVGA